jgi:hypothetical protein
VPPAAVVQSWWSRLRQRSVWLHSSIMRSGSPNHTRTLSLSSEPVVFHTHTHRTVLPLYKYTLTAWPLWIGPICCPETSVTNRHSTLREVPKERRSDLGLSPSQSIYCLLLKFPSSKYCKQMAQVGELARVCDSVLLCGCKGTCCRCQNTRQKTLRELSVSVLRWRNASLKAS